MSRRGTGIPCGPTCGDQPPRGIPGTGTSPPGGTRRCHQLRASASPWATSGVGTKWRLLRPPRHHPGPGDRGDSAGTARVQEPLPPPRSRRSHRCPHRPSRAVTPARCPRCPRVPPPRWGSAPGSPVMNIHGALARPRVCSRRVWPRVHLDGSAHGSRRYSAPAPAPPDPRDPQEPRDPRTPGLGGHRYRVPRWGARPGAMATVW